ncbi:MAG: AAC(3) family N-acetyltransferase [Microbacterium sp.]|jgi:aminoglycoside 3-N-acetyltransferase|nr:AAC(3) family N-acetyltransferase [Microbacterium sp.]
MREDTRHSAALTLIELIEGWRRVGVTEGMSLIVHSSLSTFGPVDGGAATVVESLLTVLGPSGTLVVPAFTWQVADPHPEHVGAADSFVIDRRAATPDFHADLRSTGMGAVAEFVRTHPSSVRSSHPQASVAAIGAHATEVVAHQPLGFAVGLASPFARLHDLGGHILLAGVGHDRNTFLHYAESLTPRPRLKTRRFPWKIDGERVWVETVDVGDDNGRHFPTVGRDFEQSTGLGHALVGNAECRLIAAEPFVSFATTRLAALLEADRHA